MSPYIIRRHMGIESTAPYILILNISKVSGQSHTLAISPLLSQNLINIDTEWAPVLTYKFVRKKKI
jgi:hypothetical protein